MLTTQELAEEFDRNCMMIQKQVEGLAHEQCLLQLPFRGNCMNWVLGHIVDGRNGVLMVVGAGPLLPDPDAHRARYGHGSPPVVEDGPDVLRLEKLVELLQHSQQVINARLPQLGDEELARMVRGPQGEVTSAKRLFFFYRHETYHTGQTELLRQLAGKNDHIN